MENKDMILRTIRVLQYENTDAYIHGENLFDKVILPALQKQLPTPLTSESQCKACGAKVYDEFNYCSQCGQLIDRE